jgi:hypothetical protein
VGDTPWAILIGDSEFDRQDRYERWELWHSRADEATRVASYFSDHTDPSLSGLGA